MGCQSDCREQISPQCLGIHVQVKEMDTTRANPKPKQNHMLYMQFRKQAVIITEQNWGWQLQNLYVCACDWRAGMRTRGCKSERDSSSQRKSSRERPGGLIRFAERSEERNQKARQGTRGRF